jgi:hypothetical protein
MALNEHGHGVVEDTQHSLSRIADLLPVTGSHHHRQLPPQPPGRRQVEPDGLASADALSRRSLPELTYRVELSRLRTTSVNRRLGKHGKELTE